MRGRTEDAIPAFDALTPKRQQAFAAGYVDPLIETAQGGTHGVGQIMAIETVVGASLEFFVVYFAKSRMTLRAPTRKAANAGMRSLSDAAAIQRMRQTLSQAPRKARGNWSRLAQEYESKINSGDIIAIAEVMRDLYRPAVNSVQSYRERQLYASALDSLSGEVAVVNGITEEEAVKELESLVIAGAG
jgi:CarD family transcriptional regulator